MANITLERPRFAVDKDGYPYIGILINGNRAKIPAEQKAVNEGAIFIGSDFEDTFSVKLPPAPENGRPRSVILRGFSDDRRLVELYNQFATEISANTFTPRPVSLPEF